MMLKIRDDIEIRLRSPMPMNQAEESISKSYNCSLISARAQKYLQIRIIQTGQCNHSGTLSGNNGRNITYAYEAFLELQ
jgi:hypothetical protein